MHLGGSSPQINVLKSKQNILIMKNEVTYSRYECQKSNRHTTFWLKYDFQKIISNFYQKSAADLNSGSAVHKTNALDHRAMMINNQVDQYMHFHKIFKSPYCDVGYKKVKPFV